MKQPNLRFGHPAAATLRPASSPLRRASLRILSCAVLAAASLPALAQQAGDASQPPASTSDLTIDSAALVAASTVGVNEISTVPTEDQGQPLATPAGHLTLSDRALLLASDVNRLLTPGTADSVAAAADTSATSRISQLLQRALALLGTPYRWGGTSPEKGFDCSGLVGYVFRNALGIELPRISRDMARTGQLIAKRDELAEGDLVFFGRKGRVDHVGIYVGEGQFVHAPSRGKDVTISSLESGYWGGKFMQARRLEGI